MSTIVQHLQNSTSTQKSPPKAEPLIENQEENQLKSIENAKRQLDFDSTESTKNCCVTLTDVRKHPWWGPKVRQLSGEKTVIIPKILKRTSPLENISKNIQANVYSSVLKFHLDMKKICTVEKCDLMQNYGEIMNKTFPWFDLQNPLAHFEELSIDDDLRKAPNVDHFYASQVIKKPIEDREKALTSLKKVQKMRSRLLLLGHNKKGRIVAVMFRFTVSVSFMVFYRINLLFVSFNCLILVVFEPQSLNMFFS